ncbi:hypothetical protein [Longitalea luteola]|uniref:hypothetical protein n=1 Tax=Longitalea luteola TaxID=2812563 RepID=UPI001A97D172|nr:hypothetical protein [Longitalea luteola]
MKNYVLALLSLAFVIWGCDKDDDDDKNDVQAKVQLMIAAPWKFDTAAIDADKNGTPDQAFPPGFDIQSCIKDNIITFKSDSTGNLDEGAEKCESTDPQNTAFNWWFKDNGAILHSPDPIFGGFSGDAKVIELTGTKLRVTKELSFGFGTYNVVLDLKH